MNEPELNEYADVLKVLRRYYHELLANLVEEIRDKLIERGYIPRSSLLSATNGTEPGE